MLTPPSVSVLAPVFVRLPVSVIAPSKELGKLASPMVRSANPLNTIVPVPATVEKI